MATGRWTEYEWDVEEVVTEDGDEIVLDHAHQRSYADCLAFIAKWERTLALGAKRLQIVLVRDDQDGRSWAYVRDGELATWFSDAHGVELTKVPQRFRVEVARGNRR